MTAEAARPAFRVSIGAIMAFQICALFARSALDASLVGHGTDPAVANDLSYLIVPPVLLVLMYPYLKQHRHVLAGLLGTHHLTPRLCVLAVLLGILLRVTWWSVLTVLIWMGLVRNEEPDAIAGPHFAFDCPPLSVLGLSFFVMVILIPVIEEVINRGFLLHALLAKGAVISVVVSSCLFAIMHRPDSYIAAFVIGTFLGVQFLSSRTLWAPILTHAAYNAAATFHWDCFQIIWNPPEADPALAAAGRIAAPVAIGGILICCFLVSKKAIGATSPRSQDCSSRESVP
jgi:membrane protease YdiL (CAAX protease family)